jgi:GWxTD domain-containing protein
MSAGLTKLTGALAFACAVFPLVIDLPAAIMKAFRIRIGLASLVLVATSAAAQFPRGADGLSPDAVVDSQAALRTMDAQIAANKKDAGAWHRRGMIAWALALRADTVPRISGLDGTRLLRLADTSLRIAVQLEPKNVLYQLAIGTLLRASPDVTGRTAAIAFFDKALELARATNDSALHATAAIEAARVRWLRYDTNPNRMAPCGLLAPNVDSAAIRGTEVPRLQTEFAFKTLHNQLADCFGAVGFFESGDYITSETLFREATRFAPREIRPFRHLAMLLVERKRWAELESIARDRLKLVSDDAWAWLALGLAEHRGGKSVAAAGAFDSGAAHLAEREKRRLLAFTRLLTPGDSVSYTAAGADERAARERALWTVVTPLWSRPAGDPHTEFLARVAFAELRWTVDELGVRGADSDRGEMHIRYGPPDRVYGLRGCDFYPPCNPLLKAPPGTGTQKPPLAIVVTYWDYNNGMTLVFWGSPTYGTSYFPTADAPHIAAAVDLRAASFDNMVRETIVDIPLRTARFRATGDSVDVLLAMHAPVAAIRQASSVDGPARVDVWMYPRDRATGREYRDSASMRGSGVGRWIYRLPVNEYFYRIEATADASMTAARTMGWITAARDSTTGFATRGFGMSDLLVATEARSNKPTAVRWTDFSVAPLIAGIAKGGSLQLIWENYELANREGQANYSIAVTLERRRSAVGRIAIQVLNTLARAVGADRDPDRVIHRFERAAAHAPVIVDYVALSLAETPPGTYRVSVEITDSVSGRKTRTTSVFDIEEQR